MSLICLVTRQAEAIPAAMKKQYMSTRVVYAFADVRLYSCSQDRGLPLCALCEFLLANQRVQGTWIMMQKALLLARLHWT